MDDIERTYQHLVRTIRTSFPHYLTAPFEVGELYQTILPYRLHRRELGLETNQDYELALMELLTGARGHLMVDERMRDVLTAELAAAQPDTARLREFASSEVRLPPTSTGGAASAAPNTATGASASAVTTQVTSPRSSSAGADSGGRTSLPVTVAAAGDTCPFCKGGLPAGRLVSFCPHCGQDLTVVHCPACGSELERGWKFCVTCGRSAAVER